MNDFFRFSHLRRAAIAMMVLSVLGAASLIVHGAMLAFGSIDIAANGEASAIAAAPVPMHVWLPFIVGGALMIAWAVANWCILELTGKLESHNYRVHDVLLDIKGVMIDQTRFLKSIDESVQLSDAARSVAHRERERDVLRSAINDRIVRGDWESAEYIVEQLGSRFGYTREAEGLHEEIESSRVTLTEAKVHETAQRIRSLIASREWDKARRAVDYLVRHHPQNEEAKSLNKELDARWGEHKRRLLKEWDSAHQKDDVDTSIRVLRELDPYLTSNEAEALKDAARDIFRKQLHKLGVQFSLAVSEGQWNRAVQVSEQIIRDFPNSRMASEVREKIDIMRQRAAVAATAS